MAGKPKGLKPTKPTVAVKTPKARPSAPGTTRKPFKGK